MQKWAGYMKGVNLGGWLSQAKLTKEHCDTFITRADVEKIKNMGFDHIRLPIDYNLVQGDDDTFIEEGFVYIDNCVEWCGEFGLNMVLDLHKAEGFSFDEGEKESGLFGNGIFREHFIRLWTELAKRYGKFSNRLAFELLNEVVDKSDNGPWMELAKQTVEEIRKYAPDVKILIGGYYNNSASAVRDIAVPFDENIVYNFHCYEPILFTHQGAYWVKGMPLDFRMKYPVSREEFLEISGKLKDISLYHDDCIPEQGFCREYFENVLHDAIETAQERGVMLYCGEYGVIELADTNSAVNWYNDIQAVLEKYGIGRALWCYKGKDFGLTDGLLSCISDKII